MSIENVKILREHIDALEENIISLNELSIEGLTKPQFHHLQRIKKLRIVKDLEKILGQVEATILEYLVNSTKWDKLDHENKTL